MVTVYNHWISPTSVIPIKVSQARRVRRGTCHSRSARFLTRAGHGKGHTIYARARSTHARETECNSQGFRAASSRRPVTIATVHPRASLHYKPSLDSSLLSLKVSRENKSFRPRTLRETSGRHVRKSELLFFSRRSRCSMKIVPLFFPLNTAQTQKSWACPIALTDAFALRLLVTSEPGVSMLSGVKWSLYCARNLCSFYFVVRPQIKASSKYSEDEQYCIFLI